MMKKNFCVFAVLLLLLSVGSLTACSAKDGAAETNNPVEMSNYAENSCDTEVKEDKNTNTCDHADTITAEELEILRSFADYSRLEVYYGLGGEEIIADHIETEAYSWAELTESLSWERKPDNEVAALDPDAAIRIYREDGASLYLAYSLDYVSVSGGPYEDTMVFYAGEDVFCLLYPWAVSQEDAEIHRFGA